MSKFDFSKLREQVKDTSDVLKKSFKGSDAQLEKFQIGRAVPWLEGKKKPEHSSKMKELMSGKNNPMYGKKHTEETLKKLSAVNKGKKNPKTAHPGNQFGKGNIGKVQDEEWKRKRLDKIKGPHDLATCPHCGKQGGERIMKRWHFDNCKLK